jgi:2,3-bisphosphoglycerate-independent phosphoglycerate mutase
MEVREVDGMTGGIGTDLDAKVAGIIKALEDNDFVLSNIKMLDIYGHDGDAEGKAAAIERIDAALAPLKGLMGEGVIVALAADHSTPVSVMNHSADPVPLAIAGRHVRKDGVHSFDEISVAGGAICRIRGMDLLPVLLDLANRSEKYGA